MKHCQYSYLVVPIGEDGVEAYKAVIPKFPNMLIMADTIEDLNELVPETIEETIPLLIKEGRPIPPPDKNSNYNGKVLLRLDPNLHEELSHQAQARQISLNKYIIGKLKSN